MTLAEEIYRLTQRFPAEERYGLTSQMRRAAVSVPSNLAEGAARRSNREFANFFGIALGSLAELETQLLIATRLKYADVDELLLQVTRVRALLLGIRMQQMSR